MEPHRTETNSVPSVPLSIRVPRLHDSLQHTSKVPLSEVSNTVLELIASDQLPEARRLVAAVEKALGRTGQQPSKSAGRQWEHGRGICALPDDYPPELRKALADSVLHSDFRGAVRAFRRHGWLHPVVTPVYHSLLRKHSPLTATELTAATPVSLGWVKFATGAGVVLFFLFRFGVRTVQSRDGKGPLWHEPGVTAPAEGALAAAGFLRERCEWLQEPAVVSAAEQLEDQLRVQPPDCAALSDRIVRSRDAVYRIPTKDSMSMMGAVVYLEKRYPELCPGFSLPSARAH